MNGTLQRCTAVFRLTDAVLRAACTRSLLCAYREATPLWPAAEHADSHPGIFLKKLRCTGARAVVLVRVRSALHARSSVLTRPQGVLRAVHRPFGTYWVSTGRLTVCTGYEQEDLRHALGLDRMNLGRSAGGVGLAGPRGAVTQYLSVNTQSRQEDLRFRPSVNRKTSGTDRVLTGWPPGRAACYRRGLHPTPRARSTNHG